MEDKLVKFTVMMSIKKIGEDSEEVFYKQDGQRFESQSTIKMNVETSYAFTVALRPSHVVESISIQGRPLTINPGSPQDNASVYVFDWTTNGFDVSKKKLRATFPLELTVKNVGILTIMMQVKFYKTADSSHSTWGTALHHIDFECERKPYEKFIKVVKEAYR